MATVVDDVVAAQLVTAAAQSTRVHADDHASAMSRMRDSFTYGYLSLNNNLALKLMQATDPGTDTDYNASVRTPYGFGPSGEFIPPGSVVGGGVTASK